MALLSTVLTLMLTVAATEKPVLVVTAPDSPVRLDHAMLLTASSGPSLLYFAATNETGDPLEQYMVMAFIYDAKGTLKVRHTAPGRRTLDAHGTKYSTLVLDDTELKPDDIIVIGVSQAQKEGSEDWWRASLQAAADAAARAKK